MREFQLEEFLETVEKPHVPTNGTSAYGTQATKVGLEEKDNGTALIRGREHKMEESYHESFDTISSTNWR